MALHATQTKLQSMLCITVKGDRYRAMLNKFLFTKIEDEDISNIWFQQGGATCHAIDVLSPVFEDRIISRRAESFGHIGAAI